MMESTNLNLSTLPTNPLRPPPIRAYESREIAKKAVQDFTAKQGYALVVKRSDNKRVDLHCSLWPDPTRRGPSVASKAKSREVNKIGTNCPFKIQIWLRKDRKKVDPHTHEIKIVHGEHNHGPTPQNLLVILRQRERAEKEVRLLDYFHQGLKAIQIWQILKAEKSLLTLKDLQNLRDRARHVFLRGRSSIEAVIESLPGWIIRYKLDDQQRPISILFISRTGLAFLRIHPNLLWIDATYKTNR
jgi:hypothetical protein